MKRSVFRGVPPCLGTKKAGPLGAGMVQFVYWGQAEVLYSDRMPL